VFRARARKHATSLEASLFEDDMPNAVYRQLVQQADAGLPAPHRDPSMNRLIDGFERLGTRARRR